MPAGTRTGLRHLQVGGDQLVDWNIPTESGSLYAQAGTTHLPLFRDVGSLPPYRRRWNGFESLLRGKENDREWGTWNEDSCSDCPQLLGARYSWTSLAYGSRPEEKGRSHCLMDRCLSQNIPRGEQNSNPLRPCALYGQIVRSSGPSSRLNARLVGALKPTFYH